jgi:hypothetical protein
MRGGSRMRLIVVAACALLVGLVVGVAGATTGGARAQEVPPTYEYKMVASILGTSVTPDSYSTDRVLERISRDESAAGWQIVESHIVEGVRKCHAEAAETVCQAPYSWNFLLRRPHQ